MRFRSRLSLIKSAITGKSKTSHSKASRETKPLEFAKFNFSDLELIYRRNPYLFRAINIRASLMTPKFKIYTDTPRGETAIQRFLKRIHCSKDLTWLFAFLYDRCLDADIFGNSWVELIPNEDEDTLTGLKQLHPAVIDFQREHPPEGPIKLNDEGNPVGIAQKVPYYDEKKKEMNSRDIKVDMKWIAHLTLHRVGDEFLGIPLAEIAYQAALSELNVELGLAESIYRHGFPFHDISIGDENNPPNPTVMDDVEKQVTGLNSMSEYAHEYWIKVKNLESYSLPGTVNFPEPFINAIAAASGIPKFLIKTEAQITRATAFAILDLVPASVVLPLRRNLKLLLENQIFGRLFELEGIDDQARIEFNEILPREDDRLAQKLVNLSKCHFDGQSILSFEEARELLGLSSGPVLKTEPEETKKMRSLLAKVKDGIYLVEPHGELIYSGKKTAFVKSKKFNFPGNWFLCSGKLVYGIIEPGTPTPITLKEFRETFPQHLISEEDRKKWWPGKELLYLYKFDFKSFKKPVKYHYKPGVQTVIKDVELI